MNTSPPRLVALDALRGFDMFWILGMEQVAEALARANPSPWATFIAAQLDHAAWDGFHFLDLIFPLFVFISGVSLVFSLEKSIERRGRAATVRKLVVRAAALYLLGLLYYGGIANGLDKVRWVGVLQRIAVCGLVSGLIFCFASERWRTAAAGIAAAALLLGYWALLSFVPVPGGVAGDFAEGPPHNLTNWIDSRYLPGKRWDGTYDPEGLLCTIPAIATCLLGVLAGQYLKRPGPLPGRKAATLLAMGVGLAAVGWLWHAQFPVIKKLWTSSYVLVAAGYSLLLLGAFYWLIDVRGWKRWSAPFVWIGMNAIALYMAERFLRFGTLAAALTGGPVAVSLGAYGAVLTSAVAVALGLGLAWFLYSRKIFLRA